MRIEACIVAVLFMGCAEDAFKGPSDPTGQQRVADDFPEALALYRSVTDTYVLHPRAVVETKDAEEAARTWLAGQPSLQIDMAGLELEHTRRGHIGTYLRFGQRVGGVVVFDGQVIVHLVKADAGWEIRDVNLNHALSKGYSPPTALIDADAALALARSAAKIQGPSRVPDGVQLGVNPRTGSVLLYRIDVHPQDGSSWRIRVDARSGEVLSMTDRRHYVDGDGYVFDPHPVATSGDTSLVDGGDGNQAALTAERVLVTLPRLDGTGVLRGPYADARPSNVGARANEPGLSFLYDRADDRFEEVMSYYHIDRLQDRIQALGFTDVNNRQQDIIANGTNQDNSWYDPGSKDITMGSGGVDDGEDADVILHEYGHSIHDDQVPGWGGGDQRAMGEGFGDYLGTVGIDILAVLPQIDDRYCLASWDAVSYSGTNPPCLRRTDSDKHFPEAVEGQVHADGEMWAAATIGIWDQVGADIMDTLMFEHHFLMSTNEDFLDASAFLLVADQNLYGGAHQDVIRRRMIQQGLSRELTPSPALPDVLQVIPVDISPPTTGGDYFQNEDDTQSFTVPGAAGLRVHFDVFQTEDDNSCFDGGCDNVYLTNGDGDLFEILYGPLGDTTSVIVEGDTVNIRLVSDPFVEEQGYHIDFIEVMGEPGCVDSDGDGVDSCSDCDDGDPANFPGNVEVCDGSDNDCDAVPDNGLPLVEFWLDADNDGFGAGLATATCEGPPPGFVDNDEDCDDGQGGVNPDASEALCDGVDNDCDGATEDNPDGDGDGAALCDGDCDDGDPLRSPAFAEVTCDGIDNDCSGLTADDTDGDGDGVSVCGGDCDDGDANAFPGNPEVCDGEDNDCDGVPDNGLPVVDYWADSDGDGFGTGVALSSCSGPPAGYVATDGDCDDTRSNVNPSAVEQECDGLDNDCDPTTSNNPDSDGDGTPVCNGDCDDADPLRSPTFAEIACDGIDNDCDVGSDDDADEDGDGVSVCGLDCDDGDGGNFPGNVETCDGLDNDCDGVSDNGLLSQDYWADGDGDGFGAGDAVSSCDGAPSGFVDRDGDCDDGRSGVNPDAAELVCDGLDNDCDPGTSNNPDADADGTTVCSGDCDDSDPLRSPAFVEVTCDGIDNDCDALTEDDSDADADGVSICGGDCDDGDGVNFPGNSEICDGLDNDCDGVEDNDVLVVDYWADGDGDGFGAGLPVATCSGPPSGFVDNDGDCDDARVGVNPDAVEQICDGLDNDCDGNTSNNPDADGDGTAVCNGDCDDADPLRSPDFAEVTCDGIDNDCDAGTEDDADEDGDGISQCGGDCDDAEAENFPGNDEACDGADNDCDGVPDNGLVFVDYVLDGDEDGFGDGDAVATCDGPPSGYVALGGDCDDGEPLRNPGLAELPCDGLDNDCDALTVDDEDGDGDGVSVCAGDCDDAEVGVFPGSPEVACDGLDNDCDPLTVDGVDGDGDGVSLCAGDCDDTVAEIFPGNIEICDGLDNDCDPLTLDDPDADADGVGVCSGDCDDDDNRVFPGSPEVLCDGLDNDCDPSTLDDVDADGDGVFACQGDCDDGDPNRYEGLAESCDGLDNDCNGAVDDGIPTDEWFSDTDQDGFGDADGVVATCDGVAPSGFVANDADCDDEDVDVNPDASELACDGLDNDCDPATPDDADDLDGDGVGACEDCDESDPSVFPGAAEICNGQDTDCNGIPDDGIPVLAYWPDSDGDGFGDSLADAEVTCDPRSGWVADDTDCDDLEMEVNPAADEVPCDGLDNDCDPDTLDIDSSCDTGVMDTDRGIALDDTASLEGDKVDVDSSGCSCDGSGSSSPLWWAVAVGFLLRRRQD